MAEPPLRPAPFEIEEAPDETSLPLRSPTKAHSKARSLGSPSLGANASAMLPMPSGMLPWRTDTRDSWWQQDGRSSSKETAVPRPAESKKRLAVRSWALWPVAELLIVLLGIIPSCIVFGARAFDPAHVVIFCNSRVLTFWLIEVGLWAHFLYCLLRVCIEESVRVNLMLALLLVVQRALLWARFEAEETASFQTWNNAVFFLFVGMLLMICFRLLITLRELVRFARRTVSQKKRRFVDSRIDVDLDLTYITARIIAMGWPTESVFEQQFRNPIKQVQAFFDHRHRHHNKVYNLCAERVYEKKCFENEYHRVRFLDHNICPLEQICILCKDMEDFMKEARENVVAVHCKAGKGRTGMIIACLLIHTRKASSATDALAIFGKRRTYNGKGVTIPSQLRYVHHYEKVLREHGMRPKRILQMVRVEILPEIEDVSVRLQIVAPKGEVLFDSSTPNAKAPVLEGDFKVNAFVGKKKVFQVWMHSAYDPQWQACRAAQKALMRREERCRAGHTMRLIKAYDEKRCDICDMNILEGDDVFECRECRRILWHCIPCCGQDDDDLRPGSTRLKQVLQGAKFIRRAKGVRQSVTSLASKLSLSLSTAPPLEPAQASGARSSLVQNAAPIRGRVSTSSTAPVQVTCPYGHKLQKKAEVARQWDGHWECASCHKHSWEAKMTKYGCSRCNYNLCETCYENPQLLREESATVVWREEDGEDAGYPEQAWVAFFKTVELDGPHKKLQKAAKKMEKEKTKIKSGTRSLPLTHFKGKDQGKDVDLVSAMKEIRFFFTERTDCDIIHTVTLGPPKVQSQSLGDSVGRERTETSVSSRPSARPPRQSKRRQSLMNYVMGSYWNPSEGGEAMGDYDALEDDTDNEVNLTVVCRGYLITQRWGCCQTRKRLCELHTNGELHIVGTSTLFDSTVIDLADAGNVYQDDSCQRGEWIVTDGRTQTTIRLKAPSDDEEDRWQEAFFDVRRAVKKLPLSGPALHSAFFHILIDDNVDEPERLAAVLADQWRLRYLVFSDDGCLYHHSAAADGEQILSDLKTDKDEPLRVLDNQMQRENYVLFQVPGALDGSEWHTLAAEVEVFEAFRNEVNGWLAATAVCEAPPRPAQLLSRSLNAGLSRASMPGDSFTSASSR